MTPYASIKNGETRLTYLLAVHLYRISFSNLSCAFYQSNMASANRPGLCLEASTDTRGTKEYKAPAHTPANVGRENLKVAYGNHIGAERV